MRQGFFTRLRRTVATIWNNFTGAGDTGEASLVFNNRYVPEGKFFLQFNKYMDHWPQNTGFSFEVLEGEKLERAERIQSEGDTGYGLVTLSKASPISKVFEFDYETAGTHTYWIREMVPGDKDNGITYAEPVSIKVDVSDDGRGRLVTRLNGAETETVTAEASPYEVTISNKYEAEGSLTLSGGKTLDNGTISENQYSVTVTKDGKDTIVPIRKVENEDGTSAWRWSYSDNYTLEDLGTRPHYHVKETVTGIPGVVYDDTEYVKRQYS